MIIPLTISLWIQILFYALLPTLYIRKLILRDPNGFDSTMGKAVYPQMDFSHPAMRSLCILLLTAVARHLFLLAGALFWKAKDAGYRLAAHQDAILFHLLQLLSAGLFGEMDFEDEGTWQFLGAHFVFFLLFVFSTDSKNKQKAQ